MLASEARAIGARWLEEHFLPSLPPEGVRGAYVMGSLAPLGDADEFNQMASDIDLAVVIDPNLVSVDRERYPHGKFALYSGCFVQGIVVPQTVLEDEEKLFAMLGLGCNLSHGQIIFDPDGVITAARSKVLEDWAKPQWRSNRTERAIAFARKSFEAMDERHGAEALNQVCGFVMELAGLVAIASATTPTHRRALALSHGLLEPLGRLDLQDRMLAAIGADDADDAFVSECTSDAVEATRVAMRYPDPAWEWSDDLAAAMVAATPAGIDQIVEEGRPREAVLPAVGWVAESSLRVRERASDADGAELDTLVQGRLDARPAAFLPSSERQVVLGQLLDDVAELSETIARD